MLLKENPSSVNIDKIYTQCYIHMHTITKQVIPFLFAKLNFHFERQRAIS